MRSVQKELQLPTRRDVHGLGSSPAGGWQPRRHGSMHARVAACRLLPLQPCTRAMAPSTVHPTSYLSPLVGLGGCCWASSTNEAGSLELLTTCTCSPRGEQHTAVVRSKRTKPFFSGDLPQRWAVGFFSGATQPRSAYCSLSPLPSTATRLTLDPVTAPPCHHKGQGGGGMSWRLSS